jgi:iron complex outermembrane receptor protein
MTLPKSTALAAALLCQLTALHAQTTAADTATLPEVTVRSSADASAKGLSPAYAGGQVARGGRAGILGTRDNLDTPFGITSYTSELIQNQQARSVGDVLLNSPGVRVARGFGNFQEAYFIRGFILSSDDIAYNGLYSLLPRQYIAAELFERVEVLRGASAFLMGASPNGGGIGGNINLLPKRAPNEPLNRVTLGTSNGGHVNGAVDIARRFGPDDATGVRLNIAHRNGGTAVDDERAKLGLASLGLDWRSRDLRLSGDVGWQDHHLGRTRPNVTLSGVTAVPAAPSSDANHAQPWTFSNERDLFGTLRAELDLSPATTAWAAYGLRRNSEHNSLANLTVTDAATGAGNTSRFDNTRKERIDTAEVGVRGKFRTGPVKHDWVASASYFEADNKAAYVWDFFNTQATNLYTPTPSPLPAFSYAGMFTGGDLARPGLIGRTRLTSVVLGDTLGLFDDKLLLTVGARAQQLRMESLDYNTHAQNAGSPYDEHRVSPMVGGVYKLGKRLSLYANHIEGLSKGDTIAATGGQPAINLPPYVSKQNELGVKYDTGRLGADLAVFATNKPRALTGGRIQGEDRHRGLELNLYGEAARGLRVLGGATWLDATQRNTGSAATEGKRTLGVARLQANLGAEWDVIGVRGLAVEGRVIHTGGVKADSANTLSVPDWTRLDVGARYVFDVQGTLLTLRGRIDNLTDRNHWASAGGYPENGYLVVGAPRTVSLSVSAEF